MSFPRYAEYKDSGVEWLGAVPAHWEVKPVKTVADIVNGAPFDASLFDPLEGHPLIRIRDLNKRETEAFYRGDFLDAVSVTSDDVLIGMDGDFNVGRWRGEGKALLNQRMCCVRGHTPNITRFLEYLLPYPLRAINAVTYSTTVKHLSSSQVAKTLLALPPLPEQAAVLAFLDHETARIDALVAEQQRLVELLKEKRQAVISHAVTKGLNPDAPMKDSGVEWLGEVPAHWEVKALKHVITKIEQGWSPQCENEPAIEGEWGVLKVGCGNGDRFDETEQKALPPGIEPLAEYEIKSGDILMSRGNTLQLVGSATYVDGVRPRLLLCDLLYRFNAIAGRADGEFLVLALRSPNTRYQIERAATGTSPSMKKIGQGVIRELLLALPPKIEQTAIARLVKSKTTELDTLIAEAERAIDLLNERRTALISAAVTGQIDVRGLAERRAA